MPRLFGKKLTLLSFASTCVALIAEQPVINNSRVEAFPRAGKGYQLINWRQRAEDFLSITLDPTRQGEYFPLFWWDDSMIHWKQRTFGVPSYVGMKSQWQVLGASHEGIATMGILLSGVFLGRDMTQQAIPGYGPANLVKMQEAYFSPADGIFLNSMGGRSGGSFWYDLTPSIFVGALVAAYPGETSLSAKWHAACKRWSEASNHLWRLNDFNFEGYDMRESRAVVKNHREPDSAAALAFLMQMANAKWPEEKTFYHESRHALDWLCVQERNPNYEFFAPFGTYAAARCNAEDRTNYDVEKLFNWCFQESAVRGIGPHQKEITTGDGYGVVSGRWGEFDVAGLVGSSRGALATQHFRGGYVFAMETFIYAWPLAAAPRYDNRLARSVGKWMHAAAHSARLFYPDQLPPEKQSDWPWASKYSTAIPYEGLMEKDNNSGQPGPFASGDPSNLGWGPINIGVYSGALSGIFGAIITPTNVTGVLAIDTNKTDVLAKRAYSTKLLYNPHAQTVRVRLPVGDQKMNVWDAVENVWLSKDTTGVVEFPIPPDAAVLATLIPSEHPVVFENGRLYADGIVVDYSAVPPKDSE